MTRRLYAGVVAATLAAGLSIGAVGGPAGAAPGTGIEKITPRDDSLEVRMSGGTAPAAGSSVSLEYNGIRVPATVRSATPAPQPAQRSVMLLLDASGSMAGASMARVKQASAAYLRGVPAGVRVGVARFSDTAAVVVAPTTDRRAVSAAVQNLTPKGSTALYDGLLVAARSLGTTGQRDLLVLSDGADTASTARLEAALTAISRSGVTVNVITLATEDKTSAILARIAGAGSGRVVPATDTAGLLRALTAASASARTVIVTAPVPAAVAGKQVTVRVVSGDGTASVLDSAVVLLPETPAATAGETPLRTVQPRTTAAVVPALAALFTGLVLLGWLLLSATSRRTSGQAGMAKLLGRYTLNPASDPEPDEESAIAQSVLDFAGRVAKKRGWDARIALRLERAAVPVRVNEWLLLQGGVAIGLLLVLTLLGAWFPIALVVAVAGGVLLPTGWLAFKAWRRQNAFLAGMPDSLQLVAASLSSGYSLPQALDSVVQEGSEPMAAELGRALAEARLGVPLEDALDDIAERMDSRDWRWVVMAVRVQREVGGNLAEVLTGVSDTMRERAKLRRQVRALSAEGRLSAFILIGMPIALAAYEFTFRRDYMRPLYTQPLGITMLAAAAVLLVLGALWMRKLIQVEA